jgi:hypothetical protein
LTPINDTIARSGQDDRKHEAWPREAGTCRRRNAINKKSGTAMLVYDPHDGAGARNRFAVACCEATVVIAAMTALVVALSSCTSGPPTKYADVSEVRTAVPAGRARLTIYRLPVEWYAWGGFRIETTLQFDTTALGDLGTGEFLVRDVAPGPHVLRIDIPHQPGACELPIEIIDGESYFFEVDARRSYAWAALPGIVLRGIPYGGWVTGPLVELAGMSVESSGKTCGGAFSIVGVERDAALPKLAELQYRKNDGATGQDPAHGQVRR